MRASTDYGNAAECPVLWAGSFALFEIVTIIPHAQRAPSNHENCFPLSLDGGEGESKPLPPYLNPLPQRGEEVY